MANIPTFPPPQQVIRFQDSKGCLWESYKEAAEADSRYAIDAKLAILKKKILEEAYSDTNLNRDEIEEVLDYLFRNYIVTEQ